MAKNYAQVGGAISWTNGTGSAVSSGDVVALGHSLAIAAVDIADGAEGTVCIEGVFDVPKVPAAVFAVGEKLIWDSSAGQFDDSAATPAAGDITGGAVAVTAGADTETTCRVKLTPGNTTLTA